MGIVLKAFQRFLVLENQKGRKKKATAGRTPAGHTSKLSWVSFRVTMTMNGPVGKKNSSYI